MSFNFSVQAGFGSPQRQNRWGVAFRLILAIPLILWLFLLSIAAGLLVVVGWFCALVLGRLPRSFVGPLREFIVYTTRMYSYTCLMNSAYPPFSTKKDYVVNVDIPSSNVRRLAVLFRIVLVIPVAIVSGLVWYGAQVSLIFVWLIVLVRGEMPLSLFGAFAAVLRFQARFYSYYMMITSDYPRGLFGDPPISERAFAAPADLIGSDSDGPTSGQTTPALPDDAGASASETEPASPELVFNEGQASSSPAAPIDPPSYFGATGAPVDSTPPPKTARLVLGRGSKRILIVFLVLGALGYAAQGVFQSRLAGNQSALASLTTANSDINSEIAAARTQESSCTLGTNACTQQYFAAIYSDFSNFQTTLDGTTFPSDASADAARFKAVTARFVRLLSTAKDGSPITANEASKLASLGTKWDTDFDQVISDLSSPI